MDRKQADRDTQDESLSQSDKPVFSLTCWECDAGLGIASAEEAIAEGWSEIESSPELLEANFCGLCPDCRQRSR